MRCRHAEPDRVPPLPEGPGLPGGRAQRVLRRLPGHHHRAASTTRYHYWMDASPISFQLRLFVSCGIQSHRLTAAYDQVHPDALTLRMPFWK